VAVCVVEIFPWVFLAGGWPRGSKICPVFFAITIVIVVSVIIIVVIIMVVVVILGVVLISILFVGVFVLILFIFILYLIPVRINVTRIVCSLYNVSPARINLSQTHLRKTICPVNEIFEPNLEMEPIFVPFPRLFSPTSPLEVHVLELILYRAAVISAHDLECFDVGTEGSLDSLPGFDFCVVSDVAAVVQIQVYEVGRQVFVVHAAVFNFERFDMEEVLERGIRRESFCWVVVRHSLEYVDAVER
jgi:hypothetical protein